MSSPSLKDLPKVAFDLKSQLEGFNPDNMKKADTNEKIVLPTAEGKFSLHCKRVSQHCVLYGLRMYTEIRLFFKYRRFF